MKRKSAALRTKKTSTASLEYTIAHCSPMSRLGVERLSRKLGYYSVLLAAFMKGIVKQGNHISSFIAHKNRLSDFNSCTQPADDIQTSQK